MVVLIGAGGGEGIEDDIGRHARFAVRRQRLRHRGAEDVDLLREDRVHIRVVRVDEGRHEVARAVRHHLVQVVDDLRMPDVVDLLDRQAVLGLREHEPVAVVVVAGVGLIDLRRRAPLERRAERLRVPLLDEVPAIRVQRRHEQQDDIIENLPRRRVVLRGEVVREAHRHHRRAHFSRVDGAGDECDRLPLRHAGAQPLGADTARVGQIGLDGAEMVEPRVRLLARDDREQKRPALGGGAEHFGVDAGRARAEELEVGRNLRPRREFAGRARLEPEMIGGRDNRLMQFGRTRLRCRLRHALLLLLLG